MKYKKTYCKYGLIEWVGLIHLGSTTMNITFSGGCQTAYGVNPACFTTEDAFTQKFIENSEEFKSGDIRLLRSSEIEGSDEPAVKVAEPASNRTVVEVAEPADASVTEVEVADQNEAVEYLKAHYDDTLTATKLRTKSAFNAVCEQYQVRFIFAE